MSDSYPGFYDGEYLPKHFPEWMRELDDMIPISLLAIPGTHDTCARNGAWGGFLKCQTLSVQEQLLGGIRYFDIRLVLLNGVFQVYHGPLPQNITFSDIQSTASDFLMKYPSEMLYMRVKHEGGTWDGFESTFLDKVSPDLSLWFLENRIPSLREVRGKIVLLQNFDAEDLGIPWNGASMKLQDVWDLPNTDAGILMKEQAIYNFSVLVHRMNNPDFLYLSHLSGSGPLPSTVAKNTNNYFLSNNLNTNTPVGVVIADYPSSLLIESIISANNGTFLQTEPSSANHWFLMGGVILGMVVIGTTCLFLYLRRRSSKRGVEPTKYGSLFKWKMKRNSLFHFLK